MTSRIGSAARLLGARESVSASLRDGVAAVGAVLLGLLVSAANAVGDDWPRFRGPNGSGISSLQGVPREWTEHDYAWVVDLPGKGHSSPVIWGEHLFVASGDDGGKRMLICLNATTGETRWMQTMQLGPDYQVTIKNSFGSGTPVTDGERVYVSFADNGHYLVSAYGFSDGSPLWTEDLGPFSSRHGQGHSPILAGERLIVTNDQQGPSFLSALDRKTGAELWRTSRPERNAAYSTPMVLDHDGQEPQIICISGAAGIAAFRPETGEELWASGAMPLRTVASPVSGEGVIIASCGSGGRGKFMVAVEPPLRTDNFAEWRTRWERKTNLPYVPTPIIDGGVLYLWNDDGVVCSVDLQTGENIQRIRVGGTYSGSPVLIDGHLYCAAEDGMIAVVNTTPELKVIGKSPLGDRIHSTPAVANGRVYFRGFQTLACLQAGKVD